MTFSNLIFLNTLFQQNEYNDDRVVLSKKMF